MTDDIHPTTTREISCDGTGPGDEQGHPRIYLTVGTESTVICPYCTRVFVYEKILHEDL